jgi:hypothetical protein
MNPLYENVRDIIQTGVLQWRRISKPLPFESDIKDLVKYWKKYYNTPMGNGSVDEFIENYYRYVIGN